VKIDEPHLDALGQLAQDLVSLPERAIDGRHLRAPLQIDDRTFDSVARLHHDYSLAGQLLGVVRRPQEPLLPREIIVNLTLVPDMVAAGEDLDSVTEQLLSQLRRDPESARRIFAIGDGEVDLFRRDNLFQMPRDKIPPGRSKNVTNKKEICQE
jgi:hypothetical protein